MSRDSYPQLHDGEWISPVKRGFREQCCDCGLVHVVDFRTKNNELQFRARRDDRATAAVRRGFKFERDE